MLELQRNVIFGQYVDTGSPIHELDPRIKLLATGVIVIGSFLVGTFAGFAVLFLLLGVVQSVSRVPTGYLLRGSRFFLGFLIFILVFEVLFYPGTMPVNSILWRWNFLSASTVALRFAAIIGLRVLVLYWGTTLLMLVTPLVDLTDGLELMLSPLQRLKVPVNEIILVGVIAIKFVPIFTAEAERLSLAQTARGVPFDEGGPITRARRIGRLLVPIFISGFRRADLLTIAMDARSYRGGWGRTKLRQLHAGPGDWLLLGLVIVWVVIAWQTFRLISI